MNEKAGFLRDIIENQDDDNPRLIYADWLEENGDPERAEFIRLQIEIAKTDRYNPTFENLINEQERMLFTHQARWRSDDGLEDLDGVGWRRGFIERAAFHTPEEYLDSSEEIYQRTPLSTIRFIYDTRDASEFVNALSEDPSLRRWRTLELSAEWAISPRALTLLRSPRLSSLRELWITGMSQEGIHWLTAFPDLTNLTELTISNANYHRDLRDFLCSTNFPKLQHLALEGASIPQRSFGPDLIGLLAETDLPALTSLDLWGQELGQEGIALFAEWPGMKQLDYLSLSYNDAVGEADESCYGVEALVKSTNWNELRELRLLGCTESLEALRILVGDPNAASLRVLKLGPREDRGEISTILDNQTEAAEILCTSPYLNDLFRLELDWDFDEETWELLEERFGSRVVFEGP